MTLPPRDNPKGLVGEPVNEVGVAVMLVGTSEYSILYGLSCMGKLESVLSSFLYFIFVLIHCSICRCSFQFLVENSSFEMMKKTWKRLVFPCFLIIQMKIQYMCLRNQCMVIVYYYYMTKRVR